MSFGAKILLNPTGLPAALSVFTSKFEKGSGGTHSLEHTVYTLADRIDAIRSRSHVDAP